MHYELYFYNYRWYAYDVDVENEDDTVICSHEDRQECINRVEEMGYRWDGE